MHDPLDSVPGDYTCTVTLEALRARLMKRAVFLAALSFAAAVIALTNLIAIVRVFWQPSQMLVLPLYLLFAAASLLASLNFARTARRLLQLRASSRAGNVEPLR